MEKVILVDESDKEIGSAEKLGAHKKGLLHRAFSILIFNSKGEMLLQKRAKNKYHSGGLWTNACCSHPRPGEKTIIAANRRLKEELGLETKLSELYSFLYKANLEDLIEHELDHVFIGKSDDLPKPNRNEFEDFKYMNMEDLRRNIADNPENYTYWFKKIIANITKTYNR